MHKPILTAAAAALALAACGDSTSDAGVRFQAVSSTPTEGGTDGSQPADPSTGAFIRFTDDRGVTWTVDELLVQVGGIELKLPRGERCADYADQLRNGAHCDRDEDDDDRDEIEVRGTFAVDLLRGTSSPNLEDLGLPAVTYRELELELVARRGAGALDGRSISLRATDDRGNQIRLLSAAEPEIEIERLEGVTLDGAGDLLVLLDATAWLEGLPLEGCLNHLAAGDDGVVTINRGSGCTALLGTMESRIERAWSIDDDDWDDDRYDD